jgi:tetratricopeptide (TPR) repeat protein
MKRMFISLFFIAFSLTNFAQRPLTTVDRSQPNDTYLGQNKSACVTVSAPKTLHPIFYDGDVKKLPEKTDSTGSDINYHLKFEIVKGYERNKLTIHANGFEPLLLNFWLNPNQQLKYYIFDADSTVIDCYNQLSREAMSLFRSGFYKDARKKYETVKSCSNVPPANDIDIKIALIDSISTWKTLGEVAFNTSNFLEAIKWYRKAFTLNPDDEYIEKCLSQAMVIQSENCRVNFETAEKYFEDRDYANAEKLYQKVIDLHCGNEHSAVQKIMELNNFKKLNHVLTYEFEKDVSIGFSTGKYNDNKSGGYFTLRANKGAFEAIRSNLDADARPELDLSFGWTIKIVKPMWIFFGPGYTGVGKYLPGVTSSGLTEEKLKLNIIHAVSPEAGVMCKIPLARKIGIAFRYTFQYRFALDKKEIDYIGKNRHVFGVGFCF